MKAHIIPLRGGEEYDMLTRWRRYCHSDRGRSRAAKRAYNRRQRRILRHDYYNRDLYDLDASKRY
jgi:hypothetical protein